MNYGQLEYKARKEYYQKYYQDHREELAKKNHDRYLLRKQRKAQEREDLKALMCDQYCKFMDRMTQEELEEVCGGCPLAKL